MTTYCSLEYHMKDLGEGHRGRCRHVRVEFLEVVLDPEDEGDEIVWIVESLSETRQEHLWRRSPARSEEGLG